MGISFNKTGILSAINAPTINANLSVNTQNFEGWVSHSIFTSYVDADGFTVKHAESTGITGSTWRRVTSPFLNYDDVANGILVSFMFKCDDYSALDHDCVCSIQNYNSAGTRIGWVEPKLKTSANIYHDDLVNGKWIKVVQYFTQENVSKRNNVDLGDVEKINVTFNIVRNGSVYFKKPKIEPGNNPLLATPWIQNVSDWGYVGASHGFIETGDLMRIYDGRIETAEFIEY